MDEKRSELFVMKGVVWEMLDYIPSKDALAILFMISEYIRGNGKPPKDGICGALARMIIESSEYEKEKINGTL